MIGVEIFFTVWNAKNINISSIRSQCWYTPSKKIMILFSKIYWDFLIEIAITYGLLNMGNCF